ncbi:TIGR03621 family F420-dependent LLM class oxidoreductase [Saccharomonospora sp. NPDC006951]
MGAFRFGVSFRSTGNRQDWIAACRRAEELGYAEISVPDHLGAPAPFPALAVAGAVTQRPRLVPFVLNAAFYNPALLARDIVTTSELTGHRLDIGIGAGHMKAEFDKAGLPWQPAADRIAMLERTIDEVRDLLAADLPEQPGLTIGGNSDAVLSLAARKADVIAFSGATQIAGRPPGTFTLVPPEELVRTIASVTSAAKEHDGRTVEANILVQDVRVTDSRESAIASWREPLSITGFTDEQLGAAPQLLGGSVTEIIDRLQELRAECGLSSITVFDPAMEDFAPVVRALAGR